MAKSGPIIVIEDDPDDQNILQDILKELKIDNKLIFFTKTIDAFHFLKSTTEAPFVIFSDVNLPEQTGIDFKKEIDKDEELRKKSIPFIFYSTAATQAIVNEAYTEMTIQGFFKKGDNYEEIKRNIKLILEYWEVCKHPNSV